MGEPLSIVEKFTNRPECRKCGDFDFRWEFRRTVQTGPAQTFSDPPYDHLRMECRRCGWAFNMQTRDAK